MSSTYFCLTAEKMMRASVAARGVLLVAQGFGGQNAGGGIRRVQRGQQRDADGDCGDDQAVERTRGKGQGIDGVDLGGEVNEVVVASGPGGEADRKSTRLNS